MTNDIDTSVLDRLGLARRAPETSSNKLGQDEFMRLMITQLRNQDPFSPMESGEFLGQLAQFGTVSGIEDVRGALEALSSAMTASQTLQAAGLVDRDVLVRSREALLAPNGSVSGSVEVPPGASNVSVGVYDLSGRLVANVAVEASDRGLRTFEWDGRIGDGEQAAAGYYELRAVANAGGQSLALESFVSGPVESVTVNGSQISLTVTGLGVVNLADVRGIS